MIGLDIILRFEKCSQNVHNRLRFSIKKKVIFCIVVDVVKSKKNIVKSSLTTSKT